MPAPILCPNCRKLIRSDEPNCPYCGLLRPGERWRRNLPGLLRLNPETLVRDITYLTVAYYVLSLLFEPGVGWGGSPFSLLSPSERSLVLLGATGTLPALGLHRWWTLVSANFLHGGLLHLFFNMMALQQIGPLVIREYGAARLALLYVGGGALGFAASVFAGVPVTMGASAAICSLIGATLYYGRTRGGSYGQAVFQTVWGWALGIFLFGFLVPGIDNWAHGGGMAGGYLLGWLLGYQESVREKPLHRWAGGACVVLVLAVLAWGAGTGLALRLGRG